ncbi:MAG: ABC transporter substrate-binding protein [Salinibacterium sp.]|nr:MAG: ABC transporter substrate-binding protein [Salinibacterium sp.]
MRARRLLNVAIGMTVAVLLAACTTNGPTPSPTPTPREALRIGALVPTSGTFSFLGRGQIAGAKLAIADINAAGGVGGKPVELELRDSGDATTTTAEASLKFLVSKHVNAVVGPSSSVLAKRLIPQVVDAGVPLVSPAATFPSLTDAQDHGLFFRTVPAYGAQGTVLGDVLSKKAPIKMALIYSNDELGRSIAPAFESEAESAGSTVVASVGFPAAETRFDSIIAEAIKSKPDVVVLATSYSSFTATKGLIKGLIASGFGGSKLWLTTQNTGDYSQAFKNGTLTGVRGIIEGVHPSDSFVKRLKSVAPGLAETRYAAETYDAVVLLALAASVSDGYSGPALSSALQSVSAGGIKCSTFAECIDVHNSQGDFDYDGLSGPLDFTAQGDIEPAFYGLYTYGPDNKFKYTSGVIGG